jgi:hypothetical protein
LSTGSKKLLIRDLPGYCAGSWYNCIFNFTRVIQNASGPTPSLKALLAQDDKNLVDMIVVLKIAWL